MMIPATRASASIRTTSTSEARQPEREPRASPPVTRFLFRLVADFVALDLCASPSVQPPFEAAGRFTLAWQSGGRTCRLTIASSRPSARLRCEHRAPSQRCAPPAAEAERWTDRMKSNTVVLGTLLLLLPTQERAVVGCLTPEQALVPRASSILLGSIETVRPMSLDPCPPTIPPSQQIPNVGAVEVASYPKCGSVHELVV